jgi:hypothetical protein
MAQQHLPSKCKALRSNPMTPQKRKKENNRIKTISKLSKHDSYHCHYHHLSLYSSQQPKRVNAIIYIYKLES